MLQSKQQPQLTLSTKTIRIESSKVPLSQTRYPKRNQATSNHWQLSSKAENLPEKMMLDSVNHNIQESKISASSNSMLSESYSGIEQRSMSLTTKQHSSSFNRIQ